MRGLGMMLCLALALGGCEADEDAPAIDREDAATAGGAGGVGGVGGVGGIGGAGGAIVDMNVDPPTPDAAPPAGCGDGPACGEGEVCAGIPQSCRPDCRAPDSACPDGQCNQLNGVCEDGGMGGMGGGGGERCGRGGPCAEGEVCVNNACVRDCREQGCLQPWQECSERTGQCAAPQCGDDGACPEDAPVCYPNNRCRPSCQGDGGIRCPERAPICNDAGMCVAEGAGCDPVCERGQVCVDAECVRDCRTMDAPCPDAGMCNRRTGICEGGMGGGCAEDGCPDGQICYPDLNRCAPDCRGEGFECPPDRQCNREDGRCDLVAPMCACRMGQVCDAEGACVADCRAEGAEPCARGEVCSRETGLCAADAPMCECPAGQVCRPDGMCIGDCRGADARPCPDGRECSRESGLCEAVPMMCPEGEHQYPNGRCGPDCRVDGQICPEGTMCNARTGFCRNG